MSIQDARLGSQVSGNIGFGLHVDVLCSVKLRRSTGADAVGAQGIDGFLFNLLVGIEVVYIVRGQVRDGSAVCQFDLGTSCPTMAPVSLALLSLVSTQGA